MKSVFALAMMIALTASTSYGITLTASTSATATNLFVTQTMRNDASDLVFRSAGVHEWFAQTWPAPSNGIVDKISFLIDQEPSDNRGTAGWEMKFDLWNNPTIVKYPISILNYFDT